MKVHEAEASCLRCTFATAWSLLAVSWNRRTCYFVFLLFFLVWLVIAALTTIALDFFQSFFFFTKLYHFVKTSSSYTSFSINEAILHLDIMSERIQTKYF